MGIITPHGTGMPSFGAPQDDEGAALYTELQSLEQDSVLGSLATEIFNKLQGSQDAATIKNVMTSVLSAEYGTPPCDAYMQFGLSDADMKIFVSDINNTMKPWSDTFSLPASLTCTTPDDMCGRFIDWSKESAHAPLASLAQAFAAAIKENIGSCTSGGYDPATADALFDTIFTDPDFFNKYPNATPANLGMLQNFLGAIPAYPVPDFLPEYIALGQWNPTSPGDIALKNGLMAEMVSGHSWSQNSLAQVQTWAVNEINGKFADYPACDEAGAVQLETVLNLPSTDVPPLQHQFFEARAWVASLTQGTPEYDLATACLTQIEDLWPAGTPADLASGYNVAFAYEDPFMKYYNVDTSDPNYTDINKFYQICTGKTDTISITAADIAYRSAAAYRDKCDPTSPDFLLMDYLCTSILTYGGSWPSPAEQAAVTRYEESGLTSSLFANASPATQTEYKSFINDPEGAALYQTLQTLDSGPYILYYKPIVDAILKQVQGPPYFYILIVQAMNNVLGSTYTDPTTGKTCDAYMQFNLNDLATNAFVELINESLSSYGDSYSLPSSLQYTAQDAQFGNIWWYLAQNPSTASNIGNALLASIRSNIGSSGDMSQLPQLFTNIMIDPAFFTKYPEMTPTADHVQDLSDLATSFGYALPDCTLQYLQLGCSWNNPNSNSDDTATQQMFLSYIQQGWGSGVQLLPALQQLTQMYVDAGFSLYLNSDIYAAQDMETIFNVAAPPLQNQFFAARAWVLSEASGSAAYNMANALYTEVQALWPNGQPGDLSTWYQNTYTAAGKADLFMTYYNVDGSDPKYANIEKFYQLCTGNADTISPTATDLNYRDAANYRDTFGSTTADYKLLNALCTEWLNNGGSNPSAAQQTIVANWAATQVTSANFIDSSQATQQKFINYFSSSYVVTLSYMKLKLIQMENGPNIPMYEKQFYQTFTSMISTYLGQQPPPTPSQSDFQNWLNIHYATLDFCFQYPGLSPWTIVDFFQQFNLQSPHVYGMVDYAYAISLVGAKQEPQPLPGPDASAFAVLYQELVTAESHYDPNNPNADLLTLFAKPLIEHFINSSQFQTLLPATQQIFQEIYNMTPASLASSWVQGLQAKVDPGSIDFKVLERVAASLTSSESDTASIIRQTQSSKEWNQLSLPVQQALQEVLNVMIQSSK